MTERAVSPSRQQVGIRTRPPANCIDSWLEVHTTIRRNELPILPALEEDTQGRDDVNQQNRLHIQDEAHVPLRRLAHVDLAAGNGGEPAPNERLQQHEQEDLQAVRSLLPKRPIHNNVITVRHYWSLLKQLRGNLPEEGSHGMSKAQEYARVLERLARVMIVPRKQDLECASCVHPLGYEYLLKELEEMTPDFSCPVDYGECLDRLCMDMTATFSIMRVADVVFVIKDTEQYARRLRSLAAFVLRCV